jgi:murein DD-endopeptidase MepM/ murein hydrolase activator NlpD
MKVIKALMLFAMLISMSSFASNSPEFGNEEPTPSEISPTLIFPIANKKAFIGSFWGAGREGGLRKHEGIDIFARKGTPVVAICDGFVEKITTTPKGGKVVWLRSVDYSWSAYYAHLDQQKVKRGQFVRKGELIGTVGNTGNAKFTPSHLHFGIYSYNGAMNPFPYVQHSPKISKPYNSIQPKEPLVVNKKDSLEISSMLTRKQR